MERRLRVEFAYSEIERSGIRRADVPPSGIELRSCDDDPIPFRNTLTIFFFSCHSSSSNLHILVKNDGEELKYMTAECKSIVDISCDDNVSQIQIRSMENRVKLMHRVHLYFMGLKPPGSLKTNSIERELKCTVATAEFEEKERRTNNFHLNRLHTVCMGSNIPWARLRATPLVDR
ncbi:hypothetical protein CBL_10717 [Carabus blaptoides fortunei]